MKNYVKFISKNYFLVFLIFFIVSIISVISSTQIACDVMCVQYVQKLPPEVLLKKGVLENFSNLAGKHMCCFPEKLAKFLRTTNFEEHLRTTADQMIRIKILEKIRVVFRISIKFDLNRERPAGKRYDFSWP